MASKGTRSLLLVVMDVFFVLAVVDAARLVVRFFGELADTAVGVKFVEVTEYVVFPLGIDPSLSSFGGVFDWDALITLGVILLIETVLGMIRRRA